MVVAYHGCDIEIGARIVAGEIIHLKPSHNPYDWLGDGVYFFEEDPLRAWMFAKASADAPERRLTAGPITHPYVIGAVIRLGNCLDLSKQEGITEVQRAFEIMDRRKGPDQELPKNKPARPDDEEFILHNLDRAVINFVHSHRFAMRLPPYDTVRGYFRQGKPAFPTSAINQLSHVQIAVRNISCITGYFHPLIPVPDPFQGLNKSRPIPYRLRKAGPKKDAY